MSNKMLKDDLFLKAFEYAPSGLALVALDGKFAKVNPASCQLLGYEMNEILTKTFQEITFKDDLQADLCNVQRLLNHEIESYQMEKRYIHKLGHTIWVILSVSLFHDKEGTPKFFISQILDISHIKRAQDEINELTVKTKDILESITDAFLSVDNQWKFVYVNQEAIKLMRKKQAELHGKLFWEELPTLMGTVYEKILRNSLEKKEKMEFEAHLPSKETPGGKWFDIHIYPTKEGLSIYFQEITERKMIEKKLVESEQWFRLLAEYSTDMITRCTKEGVYSYVSPICFSLLGYKPEEILGRSAFDFFHPDDLAQISSSYEKIIKTADIQTVSYRILKKDGSYTWFETTSRTIRDNQDNITEIIAVSRDITERKASEIKMYKTNELLIQLSMTDGLTGIANRRSFDETLEHEWKVTARLGQPISLLLCDIDFFKAYNDTYGHQAGDACLQKVANTLKKALNRPNDFVARYGGEEFSIILPNTNEDGAIQVSEMIRNLIEELQIPHFSSKVKETEVISLSIGIVTIIPSPLLTPNMLIEHADKALYQAKTGGRNRVAVYEK